jgi:hypothetical protein
VEESRLSGCFTHLAPTVPSAPPDSLWRSAAKSNAAELRTPEVKDAPLNVAKVLISCTRFTQSALNSRALHRKHACSRQ